MKTSNENALCTAPPDNPSYVARMENINQRLILALERLAIIIHRNPSCEDNVKEVEPSQLGRLGDQIRNAEESVEEAIVQIDRIVSTL